MKLDTIPYNKEIQDKKSKIVDKLVKDFNIYIQKKEYYGINDFVVKLYIKLPRENVDHLYKMYKPKFIEKKVLRNPHTNEIFELNKYFDYSVMITDSLYFIFLEGTDTESKKIIARAIYNSFSKLDYLSKKVKEFNLKKFKNDLQQFFVERNLIKN
jgi:hypothetical protein